MPRTRLALKHTARGCDFGLRWRTFISTTRHHCQLGPSNVHGEGVVTDKPNADRFTAYDVLALTECCGLTKDIVCGFKSPCSRLGLAGRRSPVFTSGELI